MKNFKKMEKEIMETDEFKEIERKIDAFESVDL